VELSDHLLRTGSVFDLLSNEGWYLLDNIYQGHRRAPIFFFLWDDMQEQVSTICQGGRTKLQKIFSAIFLL